MKIFKLSKIYRFKRIFFFTLLLIILILIFLLLINNKNDENKSEINNEVFNNETLNLNANANANASINSAKLTNESESFNAENSTEQIETNNIEFAQVETTSEIPQTNISPEQQKENYIYSLLSSSKNLPESYDIEVDCILQNPELPTGCEITALTTVLNYLNYDVDKIEMARDYLITAPYGEADFNDAFIGSPFNSYSYGCYSPVIKKTADKFLDDHQNIHNAYDISGHDFYSLFYLIAEDIPIIVWATMSLVETNEKYVWTLEGGEDITWNANEHCMVLTGFDTINNTVTVSDPLKGIVKYDINKFQERYIELDKQAVIIY